MSAIKCPRCKQTARRNGHNRLGQQQLYCVHCSFSGVDPLDKIGRVAPERRVRACVEEWRGVVKRMELIACGGAVPLRDPRPVRNPALRGRKI